MPVSEVLAARSDEVLRRWKEHVQGKLAPDALNSVELTDQMPLFIDRIVTALRPGTGRAAEDAELDSAAAEHGQQRLRLGFSLDAVVWEYGLLRAAIVETLRDAGEPVDLRDLQIIFESIITGIAEAVSEYSRQRDAELMRLANEHFAFIAHELRNPLGSARTAFELLQKRGVLPRDDSAVRALGHGLVQITDLIHHTLSVARVVSGVELERTRTELAALLRDVELESRFEAEAKGVTLSVADEVSGSIDVDRRLVHSALGNLVRNAVKYSREGGSVEVRARRVGERVSIEVQDSCGGLPPGRVEEAFAPFVRLHKHRSGFGLGLSIAKQAAEAHGGAIRIQNLPGRGCVFVLELPLNEPR